MNNIFFNQIGAYTSKLRPEDIKPLTDEIEKIKNDPEHATKWNKKLAGNLKKEFLLTDCHGYMEKFLLPLVSQYDKSINYLSSINVLTGNYPLVLDTIWVNFQEKTEFNPIHNHAGIYSFVIWIKIPYNIQDEIDASPGKDSNLPLAGHFCFYYTNDLGKIAHYDIPADSSFEYTIVVFPSELNHCVYPFYTSDEYRVSVSGNFKLKVD